MSENPETSRMNDEGSKTIVLGELLAKAAQAEQRRRARGQVEPSPMPGGKYDFWRGETSLLKPVPNALDAALTQLCQRFAQSDEQTRARLRTLMSMDEFYTLLTFSRRAAVFALRERSRGWVTDGLTALAMIEFERVDWRDVLWALSLLNHSAERIGLNADQVLADAARLAEPEVAKLIAGFIRRPPAEKDLRSSWGYDEVETDQGIGFIGWGSRAYHPTYDLKQIAIEIADFIATDKYQPNSVEVATELPKVWLETKDNAALERALKGVRAGASVSAELRPDEHPNSASQMFHIFILIFIMELADESAAQTLLAISKTKKPESYCLVGLAEKNLFCLTVARSYVVGVESFETTESLGRFANGLTSILRRHIGQN